MLSVKVTLFRNYGASGQKGTRTITNISRYQVFDALQTKQPGVLDPPPHMPVT